MTTQQNTGELEEQNSEASEDATAVEAVGSDETVDGDSSDRNGTVSPQRQAEVLERDGYQCRVCGRCGPQRGGLATLHIHHLERDPDEMDEDDPRNLTTLCRGCHNWFHQRATPEESPVSITEADLEVLLPHDIEILRVLAAAGPARTGDIADRLTIDLSVTAVRERLWLLMGLDRMVESRDQQIVDQDVSTGEWGLVEQIERSSRGHIPDDRQVLLQRIEDEQIRQALERGVGREAIMDVFDLSRRSTFYKEKRAYAYGFPLDAFRRGEDVSLGSESRERDGRDETAGESLDEQQRLDMVADPGDVPLEESETWGSPESESDARSATVNKQENGHVNGGAEDVVSDGLEGDLQEAIDALQQVSDAL